MSRTRLDQFSHKRLALACEASIALRSWEIETFAEDQFKPIDVELIDDFRHHGKKVIAHLGKGEIHPIAGDEGRALRHLRNFPLGIFVKEHPPLVGCAVAVVHAKTSEKIQPVLARLVEHHL